MSKDLEKQIEEAANNLVEDDYGFLEYIRKNNLKESFVDFAKSPETKQYWQQGIYTEEEVHRLLNQCNCLSKSIEDFNEQEWFEQNKKK